MQKNLPLRRLLACLLLSASPLTITACQLTKAPAYDTSSSAPHVESDTSEAALRAYYEALIADLRQSLLDEKQADYVNRLDYEARIAELEAKLSALEGIPAAGTDIQVSVPPSPAVTSPAENPTTVFHYTLTDGCVVIYAYTGTAQDVIIPAEIAGHPVTRIADNAFQSAAVTSVEVPDSVTEIGWFAFANCKDLTTIILPASLTTIHYGAFDGCPSLTVLCPKDSYAAEYAKSFGLRVVHGEK